MPKPRKNGTLIKLADRALRKLAKWDGWENVTTGHGTSRDKRSSSTIKDVAPSSNRRQEFENFYSGDDMAGKIVDLPASEMVREWIKINVDMGKPDRETRGIEADENVTIADNTLQALEDLNARQEMAWGLAMADVFGGALMFVAADDGGGLNPESMREPLREDNIKSISHLTVFDRWDVEIEKDYDVPFHPKFGQPELYRLVTQTTARGSAAQPGSVVHETRMIRFDGVRTTRIRRARNAGWDDSVYVRIDEMLADFGIGWAGAANALTDFAQAVFKMKGLGEAVGSAEQADRNLVLSRMEIMDLCRSTLRMIPIDADDEDWERMVTPLAGVADILDRFMLRLSSAARMPVSILFGEGPRGLDNTAEGDIKIWGSEIKGRQERKLRTPLERLIELLFKSKDGPTRGAEPDGWRMFFNELFPLTEKEKAEVRNTQMKTDTGYIEHAVVAPEEVRQSRFGGEEYSTETVLDPEVDEGDRLAATDPDAEPGADPSTEPTGGGSEAMPVIEPAEALNGAQVTSLVDVVRAARAGELTRESALEIITVAFPISTERAERILGEEEEPPDMDAVVEAPAIEPTLLTQKTMDHYIAAGPGGWPRLDQAASLIQTLIFDPDSFTRGQAVAWARDHDFKSSKVDVTGTGSIRLRQRAPGEFEEGSLRTIRLRAGVQAVIGRPKG